MTRRTRAAESPSDSQAHPPGWHFRAETRLTTKAGEVLAEIGESCERVPETSLAWLREQGLIVPREDA